MISAKEFFNEAVKPDVQPQNKPPILIIDDEPQLRQLLGDRLEASGFQAILASDGREGVKLVQEENPDVVLLDLEMPEMDGMATLAAIRKLNPTIPVIILTAHGTARKALDAKQCGAGDFLLKSDEPFLLLAAIEKALSGKVCPRANYRAEF